MPSSIIAQLDTYGPRQCARMDYAAADAYTQHLVKTHYENFTVVSWLLPPRLRVGFRHVYAFCRWADDLGDETGDPARSLELLTWWRQEVDACYAGQPRHPVFVALWRTIQDHDIPRKPFDDLIDAFVQDQQMRRYDNFAQTFDYCTRSANPVGRLVLYLCGCRDEERQQLSDATCTALQLANFWQDVRRDILERDRVYIPTDVAATHALDISTMVTAVRADSQRTRNEDGGARCAACAAPSAGILAILPAYRATLKDLVDRTWTLFLRGRDLWPLVPRDARVDVQLFTLGGEKVLKMIERQAYDTLTRRPVLSKGAKASLMLRALVGKLISPCCGSEAGKEGARR